MWKLICLIVGHKMKFTESGNIASGGSCLRCGDIWPEIKWPRMPKCTTNSEPPTPNASRHHATFIGTWRIANAGTGKVSIYHADGEGGEFSERKLAKVIAEFYRREF